MKKRIAYGLISGLFCSSVFAIAPVTLSGPSPALSSTYTANTSTLVTYTLKNNVHQKLPLIISGISNEIERVPVTNDCGNALPEGPATCNFGLNISPTEDQIGSSVHQILNVDYLGRASLTSPLSFSVAGAYAYVSPALNASSIDQFLLGSEGQLLSYSAAYTASNPASFGQMTFATVAGIQYAYLLDPNGAVYWCNINVDGSFSHCMAAASLPVFGTWQARGIAFATYNAQYAYIVDPGNNVVYQCGLDISGNFLNCLQAPSPYNLPTLAPFGIAFATAINGAQQAYIADAGMGGSGNFGDILMCSMHDDGSFNTCSETPSLGVPQWVPVAIAFNNFTGTQYAYVADNGSGTPGHVYRCSLNSDGSFENSSCIQTPVNDVSLTNWYPYYIAFQTVNGKEYAYVVNSSGSLIGNIYKCLLDSNGLLTNCVLTPSTPPLPWQPSGIAFR